MRKIQNRVFLNIISNDEIKKILKNKTKYYLYCNYKYYNNLATSLDIF